MLILETYLPSKHLDNMINNGIQQYQIQKQARYFLCKYFFSFFVLNNITWFDYEQQVEQYSGQVRIRLFDQIKQQNIFRNSSYKFDKPLCQRTAIVFCMCQKLGISHPASKFCTFSFMYVHSRMDDNDTYNKSEDDDFL